jgi:antitoxin component YwqK of YwqJK toxin-antitoxin module
MNQKTFLALLLVNSTLLQAELFTEHFKDGVVKSQIEYKKHTRTDTTEGVKNGSEKVYYNSGELAFKVQNIEGKRDGAMVWYDRDKNHLERIYYKMGKRSGNNKIFYDDGTLRIEVNYIDDKKEGFEKFYFSSGKLASEVTYVSGRKEGLQKEYNNDGSLNNEVTYKHGYKEGERRWYDKNEKVTKTLNYKMDRPIEVMKKVQAKKTDITIKALQGLDFNPNNRKVD